MVVSGYALAVNNYIFILVMKFTAAILALLIAITSAYPVPRQLTTVKSMKCHMMTPCCKKMNFPSKKGDEKDDCNSGGCNPFSICNYFPGVPSLFPISPETICIIITQRFNLFNDNIRSGYYAECWHPPQPC